ncbi:deoxyribose-phosphate aldolase [Tenacibaculum sp. IB213877]|uniref:deoxyribose-phosphate aldolase n=1 Tax=Tenacibaculum sp. IB213877 TaxID=3097351 RepID=UPI002A59BE04|nr:deoxyribose-phosphate aldolase [Tenacibaculum sp. IB213877]MDY0781413.1 deoxyribose-phosphate aldolase [Tenacibaculum sp. IB213877]
MKIQRYIDHTLLKPTATEQDIIQLCNEAAQHHFYAVCVNGCYVPLAKEQLKNTTVKVAAVIGFPLGAMSTEAKVFEAKKCIENGANEIDMVINVGMLKSGDNEYVEQEIAQIKEAIGDNVLKVILENCYLTKKEIELACQLCLNANADFVKTSTGFGTGGATFEDVAIMNSIVDGEAQIKAAGGIRDLETALKYIEMGVTRLGTSSGVALVTTGIADKNQY